MSENLQELFDAVADLPEDTQFPRARRRLAMLKPRAILRKNSVASAALIINLQSSCWLIYAKLSKFLYFLCLRKAYIPQGDYLRVIGHLQALFRSKNNCDKKVFIFC
jgi:hypothetical protein